MEKLDNRGCVVLVPVGSRVEPGCEVALRSLEAHGYEVRRLYGYSAVDQARNQMATDAMAEGFEETMWIDSDIAFSPDAVDRLRSHRLPLVCGLYPKKAACELSSHLLHGTDAIIFGNGGGLTEILYAAAGFLLVHREVYLNIESRLKLPVCNEFVGRPLVPYFMPMVHVGGGRTIYLAEDWAFSHRARQCGYRIWADTAFRLWHMGSYGYSFEDVVAAPERKESLVIRLDLDARLRERLTGP